MKIEVFDPALCCSTGVCGPSVDPELIRIAADLDTIRKHGFDVKRYNLSQDIQAFTINQVALAYLQQHGSDAFPITLVDGELKTENRYPTREELTAWTGVSFESGNIGKKTFKTIKVQPKSQSCCEPGSGCC